MHVCTYVYISRTVTPIRTKLGMLMPLDHEENLERSKLKIVQSSSPDEGGSCNSETKHDRRTAPRSKWFVSAARFLFKHIVLSIYSNDFINETTT
jgi:hypothetical protein